EQTSAPSKSTEHEPHSPCSQAFFEPGSSSVSRRNVRRLSPPQASASRRSPLTVSEILTSGGTSRASARRGRGGHGAGSPLSRARRRSARPTPRRGQGAPPHRRAAR